MFGLPLLWQVKFCLFLVGKKCDQFAEKGKKKVP